MQAQHVMSVPVITVAPDTGVCEIARILSERRISAVPVLDAAGRIVGIVSEGDLLRRPELGTEPRRSWWLDLLRDASHRVEEYVKTHGLKASDVMTRDVATVSPTTSIAEIAALLERRRIKRVPVVDNGKAVGIVSRANIVRALASQTPPPSTIAASDEALRENLLEVLHKEGLVSNSSINPIALNGVLHLWGGVETEEQRDAIRIAAELIAGTNRVQNHIVIQRLPMHAG